MFASWSIVSLLSTYSVQSIWKVQFCDLMLSRRTWSTQGWAIPTTFFYWVRLTLLYVNTSMRMWVWVSVVWLQNCTFKILDFTVKVISRLGKSWVDPEILQSRTREADVFVDTRAFRLQNSFIKKPGTILFIHSSVFFWLSLKIPGRGKITTKATFYRPSLHQG